VGLVVVVVGVLQVVTGCRPGAERNDRQTH
jgi:hypothetical protein